MLALEVCDLNVVREKKVCRSKGSISLPIDLARVRFWTKRHLRLEFVGCPRSFSPRAQVFAFGQIPAFDFI